MSIPLTERQPAKEKEMAKLLFALIRESRRSDKELAKSMGLSQPSVSRKRAWLEEKGFIKEYTITPNLRKMGFELLVFTLLDFNQPLTDETNARARQWVEKEPSVLFWADGEGAGIGSIMVSVHKSYGDFSKFMSQFRMDWQANVKTLQNFYVSFSRAEQFIRDFSFRYLQDY
jgi:DNA-binding Lrp family transcriptional regulator